MNTAGITKEYRTLTITGNATCRYVLTLREDGAWGIGVTVTETGECAFAPDVCREEDEARRIWEAVTTGCVTPVTLFDVLYDLLP